MNKKLIAIIVAVAVVVVAIVDVVIAVSVNKDKPDDNVKDAGSKKEPTTEVTPDEPSNTDPDNGNENTPGGIQIGPSQTPEVNEGNGEGNSSGGNEGGNENTPSGRCKYCNKTLVSKYDNRVNDLDNYCDGDCIGWLG